MMAGWREGDLSAGSASRCDQKGGRVRSPEALREERKTGVKAVSCILGTHSDIDLLIQAHHTLVPRAIFPGWLFFFKCVSNKCWKYPGSFLYKKFFMLKMFQCLPSKRF